MNPRQATDEPGGGKLPENILQFARTLRAAGLPVGTGQVIDAVRAVARAGIVRREDVYWALRAVLVKRQSEMRLFEQAFHLYFRNPRLLERLLSLLLPHTPREPGGRTPQAGFRRLLEALGDEPGEARGERRIDIDRAGTASAREILRNRDFEQMSLAEQQEAKQLLRTGLPPLRPRKTRRFHPSQGAGRYDLQRTLRQMQRGPAELIPLARKRPTERPPDVVLLCDISGSMSAYSRMFLLLAHALTRREPVVHSFVFGTRLSHVSHHLRHHDVDEAMDRVSATVSDWDGGTRIGSCLGEFNRLWGRRVLARSAVVLLLTDGLERDPDSGLAEQLQRLQRSCASLIWMNPMLRYRDFEPRAAGVRTMLPHVDRFVPAHNLVSIHSVVQSLAAPRRS